MGKFVTEGFNYRIIEIDSIPFQSIEQALSNDIKFIYIGSLQVHQHGPSIHHFPVLPFTKNSHHNEV